MKQKVFAVVGARPQFIKAAALAHATKKAGRPFSFQIDFVHTGQHYDYRMSQSFFEELSIPRPRHNLRVGSGSHASQTGQILERFEKILLKERPAVVMVFGDTNSTLAGALAAAKLGIPVAHVEAGMRAHTRALPEETNRILTDRLSSLLFCPSAHSASELRQEGIRRNVYIVGDVMADVLKMVSPRLRMDPFTPAYYLATIHRNSNTDDLEVLLKILKALTNLNCPVRFPMHPRTKKMIQSRPLLSKFLNHPALRLSEPVSYSEMLDLQKNSRGIITDSGGVQKEAFWLGIPCVTLRNETEWPETVEAGWNILCKPDAVRIRSAFKKLESKRRIGPPKYSDPAGASLKILKILDRFIRGHR